MELQIDLMKDQQSLNYYDVYRLAHNNATDLLHDAKILFENRSYARAYFLAYSALEEIAKSQKAADVYTRFTSQNEFTFLFSNHRKKIGAVQWAHLDANEYPNNSIWLGPDVDDAEPISPKEPLWKKRQQSLYVDIYDNKAVYPKDEITDTDAKEIIHIVDVALHRIWEVTEYYGHQIGTKGFMK